MRRAALAIPLLCLVAFAAGGGSVAAYQRVTHVRQITYEHAIYLLDTEPGDTEQARLAQQRLKSLVSIALATLARQAASGGPAGEDAARFLEAVRKELSR